MVSLVRVGEVVCGRGTIVDDLKGCGVFIEPAVVLTTGLELSGAGGEVTSDWFMFGARAFSGCVFDVVGD